MIKHHLTDTEIQQYAINSLECSKDVTHHITNCAECQMKLKQYKVLIDEFTRQPTPVFSFDLEALVMEQLPARVEQDMKLIYLVLVICLFPICLMIYLFGANIINLFTSLRPLSVAFIGTVALCVLVFIALDNYREFQKRMRLITSLQKLQP